MLNLDEDSLEILLKKVSNKINHEINYSASSFMINSTSYIYRKAKLTPKKQGLFVAIWKRDHNNITVPYELSDHFDYMIINVENDNKQGLFIFPKTILYKHGVIAGENSRGKNGIRVYPPWDEDLNKTALKTQSWQQEFFLEVNPKSDEMKKNINRKKLLNSKWTAVRPQKKEKHFIVTKVKLNEEDPQIIDYIVITSAFTNNSYQIDYKDLQNDEVWLQGWK